MDREIKLNFTPTRQDYARVLRIFYLHHARTMIALLGMAILFILALVFLLAKTSAPTLFEVLWVILPLLVVVYMLFLQPSLIARQAEQNEQLRAEVTWVVDDPGMQVTSRFGVHRWSWDHFSRMIVTREYILLLGKVDIGWFRFLPRRAFSSPQDERRFLELARKQVQ